MEVDDCLSLTSIPWECFFQVLLRLDVPDCWCLSGVCRSWRELLLSPSFWKQYCDLRAWDWAGYLEKHHKREDKAKQKEKLKGYRKRRVFIPFAGLEPSVRMFARKMFLKISKANIVLRSSQAARDGLRDPIMRRAYGGDVEGFLGHILSLDNNFVLALNSRGLFRIDEGRYEEALSDLSRCVLLWPFFADAWSNMGLALHELGRLEEALRCYNRAASLEGDCVTLNNRGLLLNDMGRMEESIADFSTIIHVLNPRYCDAYNNRAFAYNCVQKHAEAVQDCDQALRLKPHLAEPRRIRAYAYLKMGRLEDAIRDASEAIQLYENMYPKAVYTRGLAQVALAKRMRENGEDEATASEWEQLGQNDIMTAKNACPNVEKDL